MIRGIFLFLLLFSVLVPSPAEAVWLFGGKKKEQDAPAGDPAVPHEAESGKEKPKRLFLSPQEGSKDGRVWTLDNVTSTEGQPVSPIFSGKLFEKLTPEMMSPTYSPKTQEELGMVSVASKLWEIRAMTDMRVASKKRIAAQTLKIDATVAAMKAADEKYMAEMRAKAAKQQGQQAGTPQSSQPASKASGAAQTQKKPPTKRVYKADDGVKKPSKVFTDF